MTLARAPRLDETNSRWYRPRASKAKHARLCWQPRSYTLAWGQQTFDGPHMVIDGKEGPYGSELKAFFDTHRPLPERENHYVKVARVLALCVAEPVELVTWVDGRVEARAVVEPGGYILQNPSGEQYYNTAAEFAERYEPDTNP